MFDFIPTISEVIQYFSSLDPLTIYLIVFGLMIVESSFIPFPSEVVIPPAAMVAATTPESNINVFIVVIAGTCGALLGAYINYYLGMYLGRPVIHKLADTRLAHALLINREKIEKAETYFVNHGKTSTFIGRLVPGIRQLISIPAGISKMNIASFSLYTFLGAGIWNAILAIIGYISGRNIEIFLRFEHQLKIILLILGILFILYLVYSAFRKRKK